MSSEEVTPSVETIEAEAEKALDVARARATEILLKAREEADNILSSQLPMAEVEREREKIVHMAKEEADREVENSRTKASEIRANAERKVEKISQRIVKIIIGTNSK